MAHRRRRTIIEAVEGLEPQMRNAFLASIEDIANAADFSVIVLALQEGRLDDAIRAMHIAPEFFAPLDDAIRRAYLEGGRASLVALPPISAPGGGLLVIRFNGANPRAQQWVQNHTFRLIREIVTDQRAAVRFVIDNGIATGLGPRTTALDIVGRVNRATGRRQGGILGLTEFQGQTVKNVRDILQNPGGPREFFIKDRITGELKPRFKLSDRRSDALIKRAIADRRALSARDVQSITTRYENRLLKLRGDTIARTETLGAFNAGQQEGLVQLTETGAVEVGQIRRVWRTSQDARVRDLHQVLEGETVGLNETFPNGLLFPLETGGPPEQVINCRCFVEQRIDFLSNL